MCCLRLGACNWYSLRGWWLPSNLLAHSATSSIGWTYECQNGIVWFNALLVVYFDFIVSHFLRGFVRCLLYVQTILYLCWLCPWVTVYRRRAKHCQTFTEIRSNRDGHPRFQVLEFSGIPTKSPTCSRNMQICGSSLTRWLFMNSTLQIDTPTVVHNIFSNSGD